MTCGGDDTANFTKEIKNKISKGLLGRKLSKETRKKISENSGSRGKHYSEEEKKELSEKINNFYKTEAGQKLKEEVSKRFKDFWKSEKGRTTAKNRKKGHNKKVLYIPENIIYESARSASFAIGRNENYVMNRINKYKDPNWKYID